MAKRKTSQEVDVQVVGRAGLRCAARSSGVDPDERRATAPFARRETPLEAEPRKQGAGPGSERLPQERRSSSQSTLKIKQSKRGRVRNYDPMSELLDETLIAEAVWECLRNNDPEGVVEVLELHLEALNKSQLCEDSNLARATLYSAFRSKNPTVKTLAKVVSATF